MLFFWRGNNAAKYHEPAPRQKAGAEEYEVEAEGAGLSFCTPSHTAVCLADAGYIFNCLFRDNIFFLLIPAATAAFR